MADVFLSYARDDLERVKPIISALEREALDVWWDAQILPGGQGFADVIEAELDAAPCVLVVWSETSVNRLFVRDEAQEGINRGCLVPIRIDDVKPPLGFRSLHTEDMQGWDGAAEHAGWAKVVEQSRRFVGERGEAQEVPPVTLAATPKEEVVVAEPVATVDVVAERVAPVEVRREAPEPAAEVAKRQSINWINWLAVLMLAGGWALGSYEKSGILSGTFFLAALTIVLFRFADHDLGKDMKDLVRRWFLPVRGKAQVSSVEAFLAMFEAVFGERHFSWKCFWRSSVASVVGFFIIAVVFNLMRNTDVFVAAFSGDFIVVVFIYMLASNIIADYLSLLETRLVLRWCRRSSIAVLSIAIIADAILTFLIGYAVFWSLAAAPSQFGLGPTPEELAQSLGLKGASESKDGALTIMLAALATTYLTSIWLWFALLFGPLTRIILWGRSGLTWFGRWLDASRQPMTALGTVAGVMIMVVGTAVWYWQQALGLA